MRYDLTTALVVVGVPTACAALAGSLSVRGGEAVVVAANAEIAAARAAGALVVYTQDWHPESTPHFAKDGGGWPVVRKGTNGEDGSSGFTMRDPVTGATVPTELDALLRERGIRRVVVVGLATDYCVKATRLGARAPGP